VVIHAPAPIARAGGLEKLLVTMFGERTGREVYAPIAWLDHAQRAASDAPGQALDKGKDLLKSGLGRLRGEVDAGH
jgi:hypothetical protein